MIPSRKRPWYMFYPLAGIILLSALWCGYWFIAFVGAKELTGKAPEFVNKGLQLNCTNELGRLSFRFEFVRSGFIALTEVNKTTTSNRYVLAAAQPIILSHVLLSSMVQARLTELNHPRPRAGFITANGRQLTSQTTTNPAESLRQKNQRQFGSRCAGRSIGYSWTQQSGYLNYKS
jgi:hypothetical protein